MAFKPGVSGNPQGRRKEKPFRDALMLAVNEADGDVKKLRKLADALVTSACKGDTAAIIAVRDTLDGKPVQALANDDENPLFAHALTTDQIDERIAELQRKAGTASPS